MFDRDVLKLGSNGYGVMPDRDVRALVMVFESNGYGVTK
jgi:hypothetical protein